MILVPCNCATRVFTADAVSPGRRDPTRTGKIRAAYTRDLVRRFTALRRQVVEAVGRADVLGLGTAKMEVSPRMFVVAYAGTGGDKLSAFNEWLKALIEEIVLDMPHGSTKTQGARGTWQAKYIKQAYALGQRSAAASVERQRSSVRDAVIPNTLFKETEAMKAARLARANLIVAQAFADLDGITQAMASQMSRIVARGLSEGLHPNEIARLLADRIDRIGITRARTIAQTEVIGAHAEAQLDAFQEAEIGGVEVEAEFSTAGDDSVCPECEDLEGREYAMSEARGLIPVHPNCRCTFIPVV